MAQLQLKVNLEPALNVQALNVMINQLKASLGPLGKDIQPINEKSFKAALASVQADMDKVGQSVTDVAGKAEKAGGIISKAFQFNMITQAVTQFAGAMASVLAVGNEYEATLAAVGAVTGQSGAALGALGDKARALAREFGGSASDQLKSFQGILSKLGPQVADNADALAQMGSTVNILSAASGDDAATSMNALVDTMLQLGLVTGDAAKDAATMAQVADGLAASAKVGAAEIPQVAQSMLQVGVAAKGAKLDLAATNAAIQVLAVGGKTGSEAGVGLRNVLGLIQKASGPAEESMRKLGTSSKELGQLLTTKGLDAALGKLKQGLDNVGSAAEYNSSLMNIFGAENSSAAGILLENLGSYKQFQDGINDAIKAGASGTDGAVAQAKVRLDTADALVKRIKAQVEDVFISVTQTLGGTVSAALTATAQLAPTFTTFASLKTLIPEGAFGDVKKMAITLLSTLVPSLFTVDAAAGTTTFSFTAMWAAITAPVGIVIAAIAAVIGVFVLLYNYVEPIKTVVDQAFGTMKEVGLQAWEVIKVIGVTLFDVGKVIFDVWIMPWKIAYNVISDLVGQVFNLGSAGSGFSGFFKSISDSAKGVADWFKNMFTQVEPVLQQIQAVVGQVTDSLVTIASGVLKTIFNILYEIGKFIFDVIVFNIKVWYEIISFIVGKVIDVGKWLYNAHVQVFNVVKQSVLFKTAVELASKAIQGIGNFLSDIGGKLSNLGSAFLSIGKSAGDGIKQGIEKTEIKPKISVDEAAKNIAKDIVGNNKNIVDGVKEIQKEYGLSEVQAAKLLETQLKQVGAVGKLIINARDYKAEIDATLGSATKLYETAANAAASTVLDKQKIIAGDAAAIQRVIESVDYTRVAVKREELSKKIKDAAQVDKAVALFFVDELARDSAKKQREATQSELNTKKALRATDYKQQIADAATTAKNRVDAEIAKLEDLKNTRLDFIKQSTADERLLKQNEVLITEEFETKKLALQIKAAQAALDSKRKLATSGVDTQAEVNALRALELQKDNIKRAAEIKRNEIDGAERVKEYQNQIKREQDLFKLSVDRIKAQSDILREFQLKDGEWATNRQRAINDINLELIKKQNEDEIQQALAKNDKVIAAQSAYVNALKTNNEDVIKSASAGLAQATTDALKNDELVKSTAERNARIYTDAYNSARRALEKLDIEMIEDLAVRTKELTIFNAQEAYTADLNASKGNNGLKFEAYKKFLQARVDAENKYITDTTDASVQLAATIGDQFAKAFAKPFEVYNQEQEKQLQQSLENIDKEKQALLQSLRSRQIASVEYYAKLGELDKKAAEERKKNNSSYIFEQIAKQAGEAFKQSSTAFVSVSAKSGEELLRLQKLQAESDKDKEKINAAVLDAMANNNQEMIDKLEKDYTAWSEARKQLDKDTNEASTGLYTNAFIAIGAAAAGAAIQAGSSLKSVTLAALDALQAMVPVFTAQIFGITAASPANIATLGTWGAIEFVALTATLQGLVALAKSSIGRNSGEALIGRSMAGLAGTTIDGKPATRSSDNLMRLVSVDEGIATVKNNLSLSKSGIANWMVLDWSNKTGKPYNEYPGYKSDTANFVRAEIQRLLNPEMFNTRMTRTAMMLVERELTKFETVSTPRTFTPAVHTMYIEHTVEQGNDPQATLILRKVEKHMENLVQAEQVKAKARKRTPNQTITVEPSEHFTTKVSETMMKGIWR